MKTPMCQCLIFLILVQIIHCNTKLDEMSLACTKEAGVELQVVEEAKKGIIPEDNDKYKDYLTCFYKKQNFQTSDGKILLDNIKIMLSEFYTEQELQTIKSCDNLPGPTPGEKAFKTLKCILKKIYELEA